VAQRQTVGFGWSGSPFITDPAQLAALPPLSRRRRLPPKPPSLPNLENVAASDSGALVATVAASDAQVANVASKPADDDVRLPEAKRMGGVSMQLDVAVERRRSWFWRLAVSLVVRRLR
jgi:hypothetical protein